MNAPLRTAEVNAHLEILSAIADVRDNVISEQTGFHRMWRPLEVFLLSPRCNCRRVLNWTPRIDGVRIASCQCGVRFREVRDGAD